MNELDYEAWRPALIAFYRADCWFQTADNLEHGYELTVENKSHARALAAALAHAPREELRRAA